MTKMFSLKDAAAALKLPPHRIQYVLSTGLVAEPENRFSGKRVFLREDIQRFADHFDVEIKELDEEETCTKTTSI